MTYTITHKLAGREPGFKGSLKSLNPRFIVSNYVHERKRKSLDYKAMGEAGALGTGQCKMRSRGDKAFRSVPALQWEGSTL